ncbi:MAG: hypothetical protein HY075_05405 [Deltaproteobacteria bacterium]|nr:hypothetical protein [Deltaproteobacteria bacterium]
MARRAAELLTDGRAARVLDVGSGAGKFCLVGALSSKGRFVGIERQRRLVDLSRELAARLRPQGQRADRRRPARALGEGRPLKNTLRKPLCFQLVSRPLFRHISKFSPSLARRII